MRAQVHSEQLWSIIALLSNICYINLHYNGIIMGAIASQITSLTIVYSTFYSGADQRKHQSSASLAFVRGIHRSPVNSPHKWPVTRKMFPFDDVIMRSVQNTGTYYSIQGWFVRNLAWGGYAESQVYMTNQTEACVACPGIQHIS